MRTKLLSVLFAFVLSFSLLSSIVVVKATNEANLAVTVNVAESADSVEDVDDDYLFEDYYDYTLYEATFVLTGAQARTKIDNLYYGCVIDTIQFSAVSNKDITLINSTKLPGGLANIDSNRTMLFAWTTADSSSRVKTSPITVVTFKFIVNDNSGIDDLTLSVGSTAPADYVIKAYQYWAGSSSSSAQQNVQFYDFDFVGYNVSGGGDPDPVVADVDSTTGEVTFDRTNATLPASAVLDGQTVKVFSNEFTGVTANKRFSITHTPSATTKKYGTSIGEYFGISGDGTVDGIVKVAILFPEGMNASDFEIGMYDAE